MWKKRSLRRASIVLMGLGVVLILLKESAEINAVLQCANQENQSQIHGGISLQPHNHTDHTHQSKSTIVVYSGPTSLDVRGKNDMYQKNFRYFLAHGIECKWFDTVIVVTDVVAAYYAHELASVQTKCTAFGHSVQILEREDKCYDMESVRIVFEQVDLEPYDYFVYLNCGMVGPKMQNTTNNYSWTWIYTSLLSDTVKMSGLSVNCQNVRGCRGHPHVQSMLFALDRVGLEAIMNSESVFDCNISNADMGHENRVNIIERYEIGMGRVIFQSGYSIAAAISKIGPVELRPSDVDLDLD